MTTTLEEMVQLGVHLGHQTRKWNPKMAPFIYKKQNGSHIIDIVQTVDQLKEVSTFLTEAARKKKSFLFVGTKKHIRHVVKDAAISCQSYYLTKRWLGGLLTNWETMKLTVALFTLLSKEPNDFQHMPKKKAIDFRKKLRRLEAYVGGLGPRTKTENHSMLVPPDVVIIVGQPDERNAVLECRKLGIPTVTILDTDCDPSLADRFVAANDDSPGSVRFILNTFAAAIREGYGIEEPLFPAIEASDETVAVGSVDTLVKKNQKDQEAEVPVALVPPLPPAGGFGQEESLKQLKRPTGMTRS